MKKDLIEFAPNMAIKNKMKLRSTISQCNHTGDMR
jgi:hypothetical protein